MPSPVQSTQLALAHYPWEWYLVLCFHAVVVWFELRLSAPYVELVHGILEWVRLAFPKVSGKTCRRSLRFTFARDPSILC